MTAEEYLCKYTQLPSEDVIEKELEHSIIMKSEIIGAMESYAADKAREEAIGFLMFVENGLWSCSQNKRFPQTYGRWYNSHNEDLSVKDTKTTEELYEIYLKEKK